MTKVFHDNYIKTPEGHRIPAPPGEPIVLMLHGSHLYGTSTPDSDFDYKGVFIPDQRDILLGRIPKAVQESTGPKGSKNSPGDVDVCWFSIHEFIKLACEGQTVAIDMLYAPRSWPLDLGWRDHEWRQLHSERERFRTKSMKAFLGYCQRQAAKYGVKGSRLAAARWVEAQMTGLLVLDDPGISNPRVRDLSAFQEIPEEHREFVRWKTEGERTFLEVCGRKLQDTCPVAQAVEPVHRFVEAYGERARQAERNEGIDWKALSHALRAGYQLRQLYREGLITFPLFESDTLLLVKQGRMDYLTQVAPMLEKIVEEVTCLSASSEYPEKVDRAWWDNWLVSVLEPQQW